MSTQEPPVAGRGERGWREHAWLVGPALLLVVALSQRVVATATPLTPWKLGGFGMFSTVDTSDYRTMDVTATTHDGVVILLDHDAWRVKSGVLPSMRHRAALAIGSDGWLEAVAQDMVATSWSVEDGVGQPLLLGDASEADLRPEDFASLEIVLSRLVFDPADDVARTEVIATHTWRAR